MSNEEFYKLILKLLPFGIDIVDNSGNILFLGPNLKERFGEQAIGKKCWEIYKDDKQQCKNCPLKNGIKLQETKTIEVDGVLNDKTILIHHTGILYRGEKANLEIFQAASKADSAAGLKKGSLEIFEDITELKQTENELRKFRLSVDHASDHIIITNPDGEIIYANKAVEKITGYQHKEIIGNKPSLWGRQMDKKFYRNFWKTIREKKQPFASDIINRRKNGEKYYAEIKVAPILDESGEIEFFIGIERDTTREKEIEKSKSEFVSLASHQLRTPLASISLASEMLLSGLAGDISREQKKYLKNIYGGIREMAEIIEFLLNVSRIEMGMLQTKPEILDIPKLINIICKEISLQMREKKIKLKKSFGPNIPQIKADHKLIRLILENLISNAIKYNKDSGDIAITVKKSEKNLLVSVSDTGYGISKNQHDKIFTKFFRADNAGKSKAKGTGLGLYIVKKAVEDLKGKIWFQSQENRGTTFFVALPIKCAEKKRALPERASTGLTRY